MSSIIVIHEMQTVKAVSDRVAILDEGRILAEGAFEELRGSQDPLVSAFMKNVA
jgi:ABC-type transporter Mla maintaining outer membrane lipid asymmetry ATPase subunit MlaF